MAIGYRGAAILLLLFVVLQAACRLYRADECRNWNPFTQWMNLHVNDKSIVIGIGWHTNERRVGLEGCVCRSRSNAAIEITNSIFSPFLCVSLSQPLPLSIPFSVQWIFYSQCHRSVDFIRSECIQSRSIVVSCVSRCLCNRLYSPFKQSPMPLQFCLSLPGPMRYIPFANGFHHQLNSFFASPVRNARVVCISLSSSLEYIRSRRGIGKYVRHTQFIQAAHELQLLSAWDAASIRLSRWWQVGDAVAEGSSFSERKKNIVFHLNAHALTERWIDVDYICERNGWGAISIIHFAEVAQLKDSALPSTVFFCFVERCILLFRFHLPISPTHSLQFNDFLCVRPMGEMLICWATGAGDGVTKVMKKQCERSAVIKLICWN